MNQKDPKVAGWILDALLKKWATDMYKDGYQIIEIKEIMHSTFKQIDEENGYESED